MQQQAQKFKYICAGTSLYSILLMNADCIESSFLDYPTGLQRNLPYS